MGILTYLRRASREDIDEAFRGDSRPSRPGIPARQSSERRKAEQLQRLDRAGPKQMSREGYAKVQALLREAQARPIKRKTKKLKSQSGKGKNMSNIAIQIRVGSLPSNVVNGVTLAFIPEPSMPGIEVVLINHFQWAQIEREIHVPYKVNVSGVGDTYEAVNGANW